jgi:hypothetical protein
LAFQATQTSQTWFATSKASLRRSQESIGNEIFSIIDCGTTREEFEYIRRNPLRAALIRAEDEWPYVLSVKVAAVHRKHWRAIEVNRPTCASPGHRWL